MTKKKKVHAAHQHGWMFGIVGLAAGLALLVYVPSLKPVAQSLILFAGFHIVGAIVILATIWYGGLRDHLHSPSSRADRFDFGWDPSWTMGIAIAALIAAASAAAVEVAIPDWWPLAWALLLTGVSFFTGFILMLGYRRPDYAVLPMVNLLSGDNDVVLDAGCGAGRTTIALARALRQGRIVAFDRFDASYIDGGGRNLIENNLRLAGLVGRVRIETGDLTALPFADANFDSVVSTNVYDHLGRKMEPAMRETYRVLKPGGRFLIGVSVPSWAMFAVGNVLSFFLKSRRGWRKLAVRTGFSIDGEWMVNGTWFALLVKTAETV